MTQLSLSISLYTDSQSTDSQSTDSLTTDSRLAISLPVRQAARVCFCTLLALALAPWALAQAATVRQPVITGMTVDPSKADGSAVDDPAGEVDAVLVIEGGETPSTDEEATPAELDASTPDLTAALPATTVQPRRMIVPLGADGLPERQHHQLPDLGRLHRQLMQEAQIESYLEESDRRHLMAVRAYVERTGRVPDRYIQDYERQFDDSRRTVQQMAKEALRDYLKQQIGWEAMQDRMKVRVKNVFSLGRGGEDLASRSEATSSDLPDLANRDGARKRTSFSDVLGAIEVGPELKLDLEDTELGLSFDVDTAGESLLHKWRLYYGQRVESGEERLRLRYTDDEAKRWFEFTAGANGVDRGDYLAISVTTLF